MSNRNGDRQRTILDALTDRGAVELRGLVPAGASRAEYSAMHRAAHTLAARGLVTLERSGGGLTIRRVAPATMPEDRFQELYALASIQTFIHRTAARFAGQARQSSKLDKYGDPEWETASVLTREDFEQDGAAALYLCTARANIEQIHDGITRGIRQSWEADFRERMGITTTLERAEDDVRAFGFEITPTGAQLPPEIRIKRKGGAAELRWAQSRRYQVNVCRTDYVEAMNDDDQD